MSRLVIYKFSELYEMSSGISSKPEQAGHGSPFVSFKTVFNNYFLPEELEDLMHTSEKEQESYSVLEGDIFLTRTSETLDELGMSSVAFKDFPNATFSGFLKRIRPLQKDVTYHKFMAFYLRSKLFRSSMNNNAIMTLRASLNEQIFSYLDLILPAYEEQKKIGDLLFGIYSKIELNKRINTELEQMAKSLYDYWFLQFDFPNQEGKPYKSSGGKMIYDKVVKREIPEGWEVKSIERILKKNDSNKKISAKEYLRNGIIPIIDQSTDFIAGYTNDTGYLVDIIPNEPAIIFGDHTRILKLINFSFARGADGTQVLFSRDERIPQYLLFHSLLKIDLSNYGYARHFKFLKDAKILVPLKHIAETFDKIVKHLYDKILINQQQNQQLSSLRDWLLPMLMNGQVSVHKTYSKTEAELPRLEMAAEPVAEYGKIVNLSIPEKSKGFAKQVLGGKIVSLFKDDPNFTHIKFQKLQYLAEHIAEADLDLNYYFQAAGPHDGRFMHTIADKLKDSKWFEERNYKYYPLGKQDQIDGYYQGYFTPAQDRLDKLFLLLANATEADAEIMATLYAVWNNRIILKQPVSETDIIDDFYKWSDRKLQYSKEQLLKSLEILRNNQMAPTGFGKEIKTAKNKSK